jgi:hypothetical protein
MPATFPAAVPIAPEGVLEPGDRFELTPAGPGLALPQPLVVNRVPVETVEDEAGRPLAFTLEPEEGLVLVPEAVRAAAAGAAAVWLEYQARGRFRLLLEPAPPPGPDDLTTEQGIHLHLAPEDWSLVRSGERRPASLPQFDLALRAARLASHAGFDQLICLPLVRDLETLGVVL